MKNLRDALIKVKHINRLKLSLDNNNLGENSDHIKYLGEALE